ncbi:uncharacterized protein EV420DRAFT_1630338 [Desarmillaria tabescens]|uniref:CHAT domain-containing protein n=1 Tax=Armillaria tabescens TaxID=1929756 RepID=A0AA39K4C2_ARMTA|nr:uncharacterized protein EV420DRAFT_1630338 [Desarmillaria tabescens]KAK0452949.1 hypothetical protein EV420DRAFT_1630338 [Desarmillaria tabescens]
MPFASPLTLDKHKGWSQVSKLDNDDRVLEFASRVVAVPSEPSPNPSSATLPTANEQSGPHLSFNDLIHSPTFLNDCGIHLMQRFEQFGREDDLQNAISALERSTSFTSDRDPDKPPRLSNLCLAFLRRFELLGDRRDLDQAIKSGNDAVTLADGVSAAELAVSVSTEGNPRKPKSFYTLACCLNRRFQRLGQLVDIKSAIEMGRLALSLAAEGDQLKPMALEIVAISLYQYFKYLGKPDDLEEAISKQKDAIRLVSKGFLGKFRMLNSLSIYLRERFELFDDPDDLDQAIFKGTDAVNAAPSRSPEKPGILSNVGVCLFQRFILHGALKDVTEAISLMQSAVSDAPDGHVYKPTMLNNLGIYFRHRFAKTKDANDLDEAVSAGRRAVAYIADGHSEKPSWINSLIASLRERYKVHEHFDDLEESISCGKKALLDAAIQWAELCRGIDVLSALEAYQLVIELLPRVAWTGKSIAARHRELTHFGHAVNGAAAWGGAIVWGQLHNLRSPVDFLSDARPDLAERLSEVAVALEKASNRGVNAEHFKELSMEEIAKKHRHLANEWDSLVETVRALPGFEDFLQPKKLATLKNVAKLGPVILINTYHARCDALILIPGLEDVVHIPLKDFSYGKAEILHKRFNKSLSALGVRTRASRPVYGTSDKDVFVIVLKELWSCIVKPVLDGLAFSPSEATNLPRLWWCTTGPLAFLPIHAAGQYSTNDPGTKLSDYVVSSYTPTLTALLDKLQKTRAFKGLLAISQPNTPGLSNLPGTKGELQKIEERANEVVVEYLRGEEATPDTVLHGMSTCNWVHMACHATQEKAKPLDSTFRLHHSLNYPDGHLPLSQSLSEESVHLAAGMLMAGYQSVLATLWSIRDVDAPLIADEVYSRLFEDLKPDSGKAAIALHHAVQSLRKRVEKEPDSFVRWVPFIHVGV